MMSNFTQTLCMSPAVDPALVEALEDSDWERFEILRRKWFDTLRETCESIDPNTGCWIWNGRPYPQLTHGPRLHRIVAMVNFGDITGQHVHHVCANKACINPDHLQLVTRSENSAEMMARRDYERFIERCLDRIEEYNPADSILSETMPGAVRTPAERRGK